MVFDGIKCPQNRLDRRILFLLLIGSVVVPWVASNVYNMTWTIMTGEVSSTYPEPRYGYQFNPRTDIEFENATYGMGFASVYFSCRHFFEGVNVYDRKYEITGRYAGFPPLTLFLYYVMFYSTPYAEALVLHIFLQLLLLSATMIWVSRYYRVEYTLPYQLLFMSSMVFLTPVGLSWFERGNFDIYIAVAFAWLIFGLYESKGYAIIIAAVLANLKWTSMPFALEALGIYLLCSRDRKRYYFMGVFIAVTLATLVVFPSQLTNFVQVLIYGQKTGIGGITLVRLLPRGIVDLMPFLIVGAYVVPFRWLKQTEETLKETFLPYIVGAAFVDVTLPAISWEYRSVYLAGLITQVFVWNITVKRGGLFKYGFNVICVVMAIVVFCLSSNFDVRNSEEVKRVVEYYVLSYLALSVWYLVGLYYTSKERGSGVYGC
jgi:hypothetical protein